MAVSCAFELGQLARPVSTLASVAVCEDHIILCPVRYVDVECLVYLMTVALIWCLQVQSCVAVFITSLMRQPQLFGCGNVLIKLRVVKYQSTWLLNFVFGCAFYFQTL